VILTAGVLWHTFVSGEKALKTELFLLLTLLLLGWVSLAEAQQNGKISRIGYLSPASSEAFKEHVAAFRRGLQELGYFEGENIVIEERYAAGMFERLPTLLAELARINVDVLVVQGGPGVAAAKKATSTTPIVMVANPDPVGLGHVASLARPGGNITGLSRFYGGVITKRLELLKEVVPSAYRVAVMLHPDHPSHPLQLKELQSAAPGLALTIVPADVKGSDDFGRAFGTIRRERPGALIVLKNAMFSSNLKQIGQFALDGRLPAIYSLAQFVDVGGLMSYGTNFSELFRRAAVYVDKILKGRKPADLPVEQPTKFELVINLKTAKQIGLTIPANVLARADKVIK
jgi:putative ABC transport system substrate-binding protein